MANGKKPPRREFVREEEKTPGYRRREQELAEIEDAGGSLNAQTAGAVRGARKALERQEQVIRLRRKRRPTP